MQPHVERMVNEYRQLKHRMTKLSDFFKTPTFNNLTGDEQHMARAQYGFMCDYFGVLGARLGVGADRADPEVLDAINAEYVESTSDERVINNSTRQNYRVLSDEKKNDVNEVKALGADFVALLHRVGGTPNNPDAHFASRDLALANTHIEDAVMRAVRHITK